MTKARMGTTLNSSLKDFNIKCYIEIPIIQKYFFKLKTQISVYLAYLHWLKLAAAYKLLDAPSNLAHLGISGHTLTLLKSLRIILF